MSYNIRKHAVEWVLTFLMILSFISKARFIVLEELPDNWNDAPDIQSLRSMDRSFVFPGSFFLNLISLSFLTYISKNMREYTSC